MPISVRKLAQLLGVSPASVSLALNGKPGVSEETREKILAAALQHGLKPVSPPAARKSSDITLAVYRNHDSICGDTEFFSAVIEGMNAEACRRGFRLHVTYIYSDAWADRQLEELRRSGAAGCVLLATEMQPEDIQKFDDFPLPLVVLDSFFPGRSGAYVTIDNFDGARMAVRHLLSRGHRRIGHMASAVPISNFSERKQGLLAALSEYPEATLQSFPVGTTPEQAYSDMSAHLRRRPFDPALYPTAFFADNDIIAVSCIRAFREWGVRIPEDISVIGFDDVPLSCVTSPRLSTVRVEKETLGRLAITLLRDRMDNPAADAPVKLSVGTSLCLRDSVRIL